MKKRIIVTIILVLSVTAILFSLNIESVSADELSDNIEQGLENIDLSELEKFYNENVKSDGRDFSETINSLLKGEYDFDYASVTDYLLKLLLRDVFEMLPVFLGIIAISILCVLINSVKGSFFGDGIADIIVFVCSMSVVLMLSAEISLIWTNAKNTIQNITILGEIMSPVILTLMVASGGTVSASVYKPAVLFLTNGIMNIILDVVFPLIGITIIFSVADSFNKSVKLAKFSATATSVIKWIIGLSFTIYGLFLSVQGITSASFDGISIKAAKYAVSNSVPIVGGYLRDGLDLIVAGSVLIKNVVGISGVFALFFVVIVPVLHIAVTSVLLKFTAAFTGALSDNGTSDLCANFSKGITYISAAVLSVGFMLFVTILLMILSANAFL